MNPIKLQHYFPIIQNINNLYQTQKDNKNSFWQFADRGFLYNLPCENSAQYDVLVKRYINMMIQKRMNFVLEHSYLSITGKILALSIGDQLSDGMAEAETGGFIDSCNTPPPEFWITFENGILYSFIPNDYILLVEGGIEVAMGDSLHWVSEVIYFRNIS